MESPATCVSTIFSSAPTIGARAWAVRRLPIWSTTTVLTPLISAGLSHCRMMVSELPAASPGPVALSPSSEPAKKHSCRSAGDTQTVEDVAHESRPNCQTAVWRFVARVIRGCRNPFSFIRLARGHPLYSYAAADSRGVDDSSTVAGTWGRVVRSPHVTFPA